MPDPESEPETGVPAEPAEPADPVDPDQRLVTAILGGPSQYRADEVAAAHGISMDNARRLWRALGFPDPGSAPAFTESDSEALGLAVTLVESGVVDMDLAVNLARGVGQTMARLSDWQVSALTAHMEQQARRDDAEPSSEMATLLAEQLREPFEGLLVYVWRRHLAAAAARMALLRANEDDVHTSDVCVGFADIVSFTALSNQLSQDRIGDLVELFEARCADVVATQRGRVIKTIGDSVLFVNDDPISAFDTAEGIISVIGRDPRMPDVRVGLASGSVVMRLGDVFGPPVNLAARLTGVARRNRIIIDAATAERLPEDQFETRRLPARPVRGFGLVEPLTVRRH